MLHNPAWTFRQTGPVLMTVFDRYPALPRPRKATPQELISHVAGWHRIPPSRLMSRDRTRRVIAARFDAVAAVHLAYPNWSLQRLGRVFDRNHTSIYHALKKRGLR